MWCWFSAFQCLVDVWELWDSIIVCIFILLICCIFIDLWEPWDSILSCTCPFVFFGDVLLLFIVWLVYKNCEIHLSCMFILLIHCWYVLQLLDLYWFMIYLAYFSFWFVGDIALVLFNISLIYEHCETQLRWLFILLIC